MYYNAGSHDLLSYYISMSITFVVVLTLVPVGGEFVDDNIYPDVINDDTVDAGTAVGNEWADEALLDVAFYLRMHKFNDFDRR